MVEGIASLERLAERARHESIVSEHPSPPRPSLPDTEALALVQAKLITHEDLVIHRHEAERAGLKLADYLLQKHLITLGEYYTAISPLRREGIVITSARELPHWDVLLNDMGQALGGPYPPKDILLLGLNSDQNSTPKRLFVLTTTENVNSPNYSALYSRLVTEKYRVRARLIAENSVLELVRSEWAARTGGGQKKQARSESAVHDRWDVIISDAWEQGASDIHMTATMGRGELKFRIHGELEVQPFNCTEEEAIELASSMYNTLSDKGSVGGGFNIREEQDAVITRHFPKGSLRLRYNGLPVEPNGVNVTLRLIPMNSTAKPKSAPQLGYSEDQSDALERIFARASGLILFLGTTGSGKSTSMANLLMQKVVDNPGKQLRSVEQPVEIRIPGSNVSQTTVLGTDFASTMRALMRADPDYLMVGEIRDEETASLALQAVRSGHLCVSTLHADGAPIAYDRLAGLKVNRSDMASVGLVAGLIYQRLVPVLCTCKVPATKVKLDGRAEYVGVMRRLESYLNGDSIDGIFFRNPVGCSICKRRGVIGRTVCAEILIPKPRMLDAIRNGDSNTLWQAWRSEIDVNRPEVMRGRTAFEHALWKMRQGICSPVDVEKEFIYLDEPAFEQ